MADEVERLVLAPFEHRPGDQPLWLVSGESHGLSESAWSDIWGTGAIAAETSLAQWNAMVIGAQREIEAGTLSKVVLLRRFRQRVPARFSASALVEQLTQRFPECQTLWVHASPERDWICATPELLVSRHAGQIRSAALAGTLPRSGNRKQDLMLRDLLATQPKLLREHQIVLHELRRKLAPSCRELLAPATPEIMTLANVHHLRTPIMGHENQPTDVWMLAESLHPTPALCGMPSEHAAALIRELEGAPRGWYGGPFGRIAGGEGSVHVGLRALLREGDELTLFAGAGIVAGSQAEIEWQETEWKLQAIRSLLP